MEIFITQCREKLQLKDVTGRFLTTEIFNKKKNS